VRPAHLQKRSWALQKTAGTRQHTTAKAYNASVKLRFATHYSCTTGVWQPVGVNATRLKTKKRVAREERKKIQNQS